MPISKVIYEGRTLIDLTSDTVTAEDLSSGVTAHDAKGNLIVGTGGTLLIPNNVNNLSAKVKGKKVIISWGDPDDIYIGGQLASKWSGTKLVYKVGSYPISITDGTIAIDNKIRNQYLETDFEIADLAPGAYYFSLFPYSTDDLVNENEQNRIQVEVSDISYRTMTAVIDLTNSDPETCVSYADDAVGMEKGSTDWDDFLGYYPVLLDLNGNELGRLNPDNYAQYEDGSDAPIDGGTDYSTDVMVAFPKRGVKIETIGDELRVSMTDDPDKEGFKYYAHSYGEHNNCNIVYVGAYRAWTYNVSGPRAGELHSLSNKDLGLTIDIATCRQYANKRGYGYEQMTFYVRMFLCCVYILRNGNLNSQKVNGEGKWYTYDHNTGTTDNEGMNYVAENYMYSVKALGIEDLWGGKFEYIDGIYISSDGKIMTVPYNKNMEYNGDSYVYSGENITSESNGYMSKPIGTTETGFLPKEVTGKSTWYFCDNAGMMKTTSSGKTYVAISSYSSSTFSEDNRLYKGMFSIRFPNYETTSHKNYKSRLVKFNVQE